MAPDKLFAHAVGGIVQIKTSGFLLHLRVKNDLEQYISQFFLQMIGISFIYSLSYLVGFFQEVTAAALVGLLGVPGASPGAAQDGHDVLQVTDVIKIFLFKIYHISLPSASNL